MRFLVSTLAALLLAGCATAPRPVPTPQPTTPRPAPVQSGSLIGLSVDELGARFGQPKFQVREGPGIKLQWSTSLCVLDAYLYSPPSGAGVARVTYVDVRRPNGDPAVQADCIAALDAAG